MDTKTLGELGEWIACEYLVKKRFKILVRNHRITYGKKKVFGEIDIIAKRKWKFFSQNKVIHFVEVKTVIGNGKNFFPEEKVDWRKRGKLKKLCLWWLEKNHYSQHHPYQIDVIGILIDEYKKKANIRYFQNVVEDN